MLSFIVVVSLCLSGLILCITFMAATKFKAFIIQIQSTRDTANTDISKYPLLFYS